jgi:anti-anti-sigma factor
MILDPAMTDYRLNVNDDQVGSVTLPALFTVNEAIAFKQSFHQICEQHPDLRHIILDFALTTFIDSSGIGALVNALKFAQARGIQLSLRHVSPQVMMALTMTDLDKLFTIEVAAPPVVPLLEENRKPRLTPREQPPATHPSVRSRTKRLLDIVGAIVGLMITAVLTIPIAIAIYIDDPGPIFFGQVRCSWLGRRFKMWKFRSMVADAESLKHTVKNEVDGPLFKNANDPRITRVGRFLRRTSLDELPQFWNVLKGDMSLVGTRPPTPDEIETYEVPQWQRLDVKPGMTGEWQVNGRSTVKSFEDVIRLDLQYQESWSLGYDVKLILKTIWVLFDRRSGAM